MPAQKKPLLTASQQVAHLKSKGVTFAHMSESDAAAFLRDEDNYLRVASYRVLYPKQTEGSRSGQYVNLDFGDLVSLARLDGQLREAFLLASIDVEHFAKMRVLCKAEDAGEDGYAVMADFFASLNHSGRNAVRGDLERRSRSDAGHDTYAGDLIAHYRDDMPLWVFLEVVSFGTLLTLYKFCAGRWGDDTMLQEYYVLKGVKALRNATAHGNCIINGVARDAGSVPHRTNDLITASLNAAGMGRSKSRRARLSNLRVSQMAATLYALAALCPGGRPLDRNVTRFSTLRAAYEADAHRFRTNSSIVSFFDFLWRLVDIWVPERA